MEPSVVADTICFATSEETHKGDESLDELLPINVADMTYKTSKRVKRRLSLPAIENTSGYMRRNSPVYRVEQTNGSIPDIFACPTNRQVHPERRSTSMPEFYGLSELRARNRDRNSKQRPTEEPVLRLPNISCSKVSQKQRETKELFINGERPVRRSKTYLPRINPTTEPSYP